MKAYGGEQPLASVSENLQMPHIVRRLLLKRRIGQDEVATAAIQRCWLAFLLTIH